LKPSDSATSRRCRAEIRHEVRNVVEVSSPGAGRWFSAMLRMALI
jgi:hypothetical protein